MAATALNFIATLLARHHEQVLQGWLGRLRSEGVLDSGRLREVELQAQCTAVLRLLRAAASGDAAEADSRGAEADSRVAATDSHYADSHDADAAGRDARIDAPSFEPLRSQLAELSRARAMQGYSPRETASFVFALKRPLAEALGRSDGGEPGDERHWRITQLVDQLGLYTLEVYQRSREEVIARQNAEISELSTPVVKLWQGILALPIIGTLDSQRTQVVMENLLEAIVQQEAEIAIIDITGVLTVDTLTAQHLLKTIAAARLMGADCIVSGIRPQIAQTMVHLGVELSVVSKATLADAFALALSRLGRSVTRLKAGPTPA